MQHQALVLLSLEVGMDVGVSRVRRLPETFAFSVYGSLHSGARSNRLGYNGQLLDGVVQGYFLGNGRRLYGPVLMRFCSPDVFSPFEKGGINAYAYCAGDPVNFSDPRGTNPLPKLKTPFEPMYKNMNDKNLRIVGFQYIPEAEEGKRIKPFRVKVVNGKPIWRSDSSVNRSGNFYASADRSLFVSENLAFSEGIGGLPMTNLVKEFTAPGFQLLDVNPTHVRIVNGEIKPDNNMIFVSKSGMTDYSKEGLAMPAKRDLTMPGLARAIRKGRRGSPK